MSVWKNSCYRNDILKHIIRNYTPKDYFKHHDLYDWCIDGDSSSPIEAFRVKQNVKDYIIKNLNNKRLLEELWEYLSPYTPEPSELMKIQFKYKKLHDSIETKQYGGIKAVYLVTRLIFQEKLSFKPKMSHKQAHTFAAQVCRMQVGENLTYNNWRATDLALTTKRTKRKLYDQLDQSVAIMRLKQYKSSVKWKSTCRKYEEYGSYAKEIMTDDTCDRFECGAFMNSFWIYDKIKNIQYILTSKDILRISQMIRSFALYELYLGWIVQNQENIGQVSYEPILALGQAMIRKVWKVIKKSNADQLNDICGAYALIHDLYLAKVLECHVVDSYEILITKAQEKGWVQYVNYEQELSLLNELPVAHVFDILAISKLFCCPDYCIYSALTKQKLLHENKFKTHALGMKEMLEETEPSRGNERLNSVFGDLTDDNVLHQLDAEFWQVFTQVSRYTLLKSIAKNQGSWPGEVYPQFLNERWALDYQTMGILDHTHVHKINMRGIMIALHEGDESIFRAKDKTIAPVSKVACKDPQVLHDLPIYKRNYLSYALKYGLDESKIIADSEMLSPNKAILCAFKPEAKKRDARLFFMANPNIRLPLSVFEDNVSRACESMQGYIISKNPVVVSEFLTRMSRPALDETHHLTRPFYVSFDMTKWSPKLSWEMQEYYYKLFAEVMNDDSVLKIAAALEKTEVVLNLNNISDSYKTEGTNFEGFNGKMLTKLHTDVMYTALIITRQRNLTKYPTHFGAFIDDGVASVLIDRDVYDTRCTEVFNVIELVYSCFGLRFSYDKTYMSSLGSTFLNEVFIMGRRVAAGMKSFLKIGIEKDLPSPTVTDLQQAVYSSATGSMKSGADSSLAYQIYTFLAAAEFLRCTKFDRGPKNYALIFLTPTVLGGLGGKVLQEFDNTLNSGSAIEPINLLALKAQEDDETAQYLTNLMMAQDQQRPLISLVLGSSDITFTNDFKLKDNLSPLLRKALMPLFAESEYFTGMNLMTHEELNDLFEAMTLDNHVDVIMLREFYDASPVSLMDKLTQKFMVSQTVKQLLGFDAVLKIEKRNKKDLSIMLANFVVIQEQKYVDYY